MSRHVLFSAVLLFLVVLVGLLTRKGVAGEVTIESFPQPAVVPLRMDAVQREFLPLNENWVYARAPLTGEVRRVPVRLRYTDYQVELARNARGRPTLWTGKKACFELLSEEPYDWAVWVNMPSWVGEFTIFNLPDSTSYIAFAVGKSLTVAEVTVPVSASVALQQQEGGRPDRLLSCPLSSLAPKVDRWAKGVFKNPSRLELAFQSLDKLHDGSLRLTVADPQGNDSVSVEYREGRWQLADQESGG